MAAESRASAERAMRAEVIGCQRCLVLAEGRTQVVFGSGSVDAQLMFVGEAPGATEDREGLPFIGASGKLLDQLLATIAMSRDDVYITNALKCRPPDNRDPRKEEIANCSEYLRRQVDLVEPTVVVTLGNFATKLLRGDETGITEVHGQPEPLMLGGLGVWLFPVFHPAAALYRRPNLELLREDFAKLPELIKAGRPGLPAESPCAAPAEVEVADADVDERPQLDLF